MQSFLQEHLADLFVVVLVSIVILAMVIWMIVLMYRAFAVSCNVRGAKAIWTFIGTLILAEIVSKVAIYLMMGWIGA